MKEDIAHPVAELIAHFAIRSFAAAIGACVAAVFDERDGGVRRAGIWSAFIHRPIETIAQHHVRHGDLQSRSGDNNDQRERKLLRG